MAKKTAAKTSKAQKKAMKIASQELKQFKRDFIDAARRKDRVTLERMIHDDFTLVDPQGKEVSKERLIEDIVHPSSNFIQGFNRSEKHTVIHSSGKAARETAAVKMKGNLQRHGKITGRYTNSATFLKGPNGWQMAGNTLHKV